MGDAVHSVGVTQGRQGKASSETCETLGPMAEGLNPRVLLVDFFVHS